MGVEASESNSPISMGTGNEEKISAENEKTNIKFGSHGGDEPAKDDGKVVSESNLPSNAAEDWPEPSQIHSFYIVKYRSYEDQNLRAKLDLAEKELQKKNQARFQITEKLKEKRGVRSQIINELKSLSSENRQFRSIMDEKRKEMEPLQHALGKLRGGPNDGRERGSVICSSEDELNERIKSLQYHIQHESIPLSEEKQILREIKQLEGTRNKVIANAAERARIEGALGEKEVIQDQVKLIGVDLDGVRKERQAVNAKLKQLDEEKMAIEKEINALQEELAAISEKRDKTFETIQEMRKQREQGNANFYQYRTLLTKAKELAANKDVEALKELSHTEVENFMSMYSNNKAFRDDYKKRVLASLDMRQLSSDGRMRNPDEKPLVVGDAPTPFDQTDRIVKLPAKQPAKEDSDDTQKDKNARNQKESNKKTEATLDDVEVDDRDFVIHKLKKDDTPKVDEAKLKEMKREEEIAKAKQAMERKKKLAEKAAAKAAIKAQKEAEKKLKEREKREKKKVGAAVVSQEPEELTEAAAEIAEPEKAEEKVEALVPPKGKGRKENVTRHRARPRGPDSLPKAILKRKKATNYWLWAAAAVLVAVVLLAFSYSSYLSQGSKLE